MKLNLLAFILTYSFTRRQKNHFLLVYAFPLPLGCAPAHIKARAGNPAVMIPVFT
jgi:hypothetical protein